MDQVTGREKSHYEDQKSKRECRLSEEIDEEFEEEKQELLEKKKKRKSNFSGNFVHNGGWCRKLSFR